MVNFRIEILAGAKLGLLSTIYLNEKAAVVEEIHSVSFVSGRVFATGRARFVDKDLH